LTGAGAAVNAGTVAAVLTFMSTGKMIVGVAGIAAVVALGTAFVARGRVHEETVALTAANSRQVAGDEQLAALEKNVEAETQRVAKAEAANVQLRSALAQRQKAEAAVASREQPATSDVVQERLNGARELVRKGDYPAALKEIIWLYDVGMKQAASMGSVRLSSGVGLFAELARKYPPARAALDERREAARQALLADAGDRDAVSEYGAITRELKEGAAAIALLEQFPQGDPRRAGLAGAAFDDLIESRRYPLALEGRSVRTMFALFEAMSRDRPDGKAQSEDVQRMLRESTVKRVARDIEVLAGAGELADAENLARRLLAYDPSESAQAVVQQHLARAGQPNLMSSAR
jgi:hypothetical protein